MTPDRFFLNFQTAVLDHAIINGNFNVSVNEPSVLFLEHRFKMLPSNCEAMYFNLTRAYPTSPLYA